MELNYQYNIEISPKDIFDSMKKNIYNNFSSQSFSSISKEYLALRNGLFDLIRKISDKMGFKSQTYFLSIYYLDILFSQNKKADCNYNILGLACLLIASKYCENDPAVPELKYFIKIYNNIFGSKNSISVSDLFYSEVMACKILNHKLNYYTIYDFNSFFFIHNIVKWELVNELYNDNYNDKYSMKCSSKGNKIMEKIYKKSRYYLDDLIQSPISLKYNSLLISIYIMKKSIENTLLSEIHYEGYLKEKYLKKCNDCFNSVIVDYYNIDYEKMNGFHKLMEENDLIKIFNQTKRLSNYFSPMNNPKQNFPSIPFNKTPNKTIEAKSLNLNISEFKFSSTKKNLNKLKTSQSLLTKIKSMNIANSINIFSGQNMPRVSYNQSHNYKQKTFYRNLGVDNCNEKYKQNEKRKNSNKIDKNQLLFLFRLNSQNSLNHNLKYGDKKNELIHIYATSPNKLGNSEKNIIYNNYQNKKENFLKKTKTSNLEKNNYSSSNELIIKSSNINKSIEKDIVNQNINSSNINVNLNVKPYYKKLVKNCGNKLKNNFNQISNKFNYENNDFLNINDQVHEKNKIKYNIVNRMPKYKFSNYAKDKEKEEISRDRKSKININNIAKRLTISNSKDINLSNPKKELEYSHKKEKKISKLLHINLNSKHSDSNISPINTIFNNKNNDDECSSTYITRSSIKKKTYETKTVKPLNNLAKSIDNISNILKSNNLHQKMDFCLAKKTIGSNMKLKDIEIKNNNKNNDFKENNIHKNTINYLYESNDYGESIFSNALINSSQGGRYSSLTLTKDKDKKINEINYNNKIFLTDYTLSGDEKNNNFEGGIDDLLFNSNTYKSQFPNKSKRIFVKTNKSKNENIIIDKEKYKNKKLKNQNLGHYKVISYQNIDLRNFEENNERDLDKLCNKNYLLHSIKSKYINEDSIYTRRLKKNPSTIVINNNININIGNKPIFVMKDKRRYKNVIKNSQIQINNNNGSNSIASLLHKIPLCYKSTTDNELSANKKI